MKFVDETTIWVQAGHGGQGSKSFRREKYIPFGGPDGGDGGCGGSVYLTTCPSINTLVDFRYIRVLKAQDGESGHGKCCTGKNGLDKIVKVPVGTIVRDIDMNTILADLTEPYYQCLIAKGGAKGLGNVHFKSSVNRAPKQATSGKSGEKKHLALTLHLLAQVGLLGLPNAGKSSLIRAISSAKPKVADYPFTTLVPTLGTVRTDAEKSFVIADIPGIISGASKGIGLGVKFLRHMSRTKLLLHIIDIAPMALDPLKAMRLIEKELHDYSKDVFLKPRWLVLNKKDCLSDNEIALIKTKFQQVALNNVPVFVISAISGSGTQALCHAISDYLSQHA